ncbi:MAG TPA: cyclic nucleotide-binding domain-containing protein [Bryobacteraceae bacterium]|nr:cyclic nucleotide-binding domain-containing protein [Bryobacteraceae bacterium]
MNCYEELLLATIHEDGFLHGLDPHHIHKLAGLALEAEFDAGHIIFHEGDERNRLYVILNGTVALKSDPDGASVQVLQPGDAFGWSALLDDAHRQFEARCLSHVRALAFEGRELVKAFDADPRLGYAVLKRMLVVLASRLEAARHAPPHHHVRAADSTALPMR